VKLRFVVDAGPRVSLAFRGTRLSAEQRRMAERIVKQGGARADALDEALDRLEQELHARGHRSPSLRHFEEQAPPDRLEIVYEIDAGEASQVASVRVTGVEEGRLRDAAPRDQPFTPLRDETLERDATALRRALHELGFSEARVEIEVPGDRRRRPGAVPRQPGAEGAGRGRAGGGALGDRRSTPRGC
jgi:hypothetical protein